MIRDQFLKAKKIHFIGIGGIGMSAVARMFLLEGKEVHGSDLSGSDIIEELIKLGANVRIGQSDNELPAGVDLVIYTVAIPENHPELVAARNQKISTLSYPESLAIISEDKFTIAVAGTHGKTTTTAMIAKILIDAGLDPTVIVGSMLRDPKNGAKSNFVAGKSKYFVVEACEYKRSFLNLRPNIAVVTNIDDDHLDYYGDMAGIQQGFADFVGLIKKNGMLVTNIEQENIVPVLDAAQDFFNQKNITVLDYTSAESVKLKVPGEHNILNAKAALVVAGALGIPTEKAVAALSDFVGTWRRFEEKGKTANGAIVYDDYGHHPSEIRATLLGAREKFPKQKITVVFQPHLYSRTKEHFGEFGPALGIADQIIIVPIYAAREPADLTISSEILVEHIKKTMSEKADAVYFLENFDTVAEFISKNCGENDVIFTMGAGDITNLSEKIVQN
jgi:UDP-N-acetylmuramate--alanine ligase